MRHFLSRLKRDARGSAVIEFALTAPAMIAIMLFTVEISYVIMAKAALEGATRMGARRGSTENWSTTQTVQTANGPQKVTDCSTREERLEENITATMSLFKLAPKKEVAIATLAYENFSDVGEPEPWDDMNKNGKRDTKEGYNDINGNGKWDADMGAAGLGGPGAVVRYDVTFPLRSPLGFDVGSLLGHANALFDGVYELRSSTVSRNEPYTVLGCS